MVLEITVLVGKKNVELCIFLENISNIKKLICRVLLDYNFFGHVNFLLLNTEMLSNFYESLALLMFPLKYFIIPWLEQVYH